MGNFRFEKGPMEGLYVVVPKCFPDTRGSFMETYQWQSFSDAGLNMSFVQDNESYSRQGTLRGLHYQGRHPQGKLVRVAEGEVYDAVVDIRSGSMTFGNWYGLILSEENRLQLYIPPGFAHGFLVLSSFARFLYKCTDYYDPGDQQGIFWKDTDIDIAWPIEKIDEIYLSDKDKGLPCFKNFKESVGI